MDVDVPFLFSERYFSVVESYSTNTDNITDGPG